MWVWAADADGFVRRARAAGATLFDFAASRPGAERLDGRGPVHRVRFDGRDLVVRHYWRGGAVATWLRDRYLRLGTPRPIRELWTSHAVRARGIPTPEILALAVYPSGAFYRADLVTSYVPDSMDLAAALFGDDALAGEERRAAWRAAGRLVRALHDGGVVHADLNVKNVLLRWSTHPPTAYVLDLDRCRVRHRVTERDRRRILDRFRRSVDKWARRSGRPVAPEEMRAFEAAYATPD